MGTMVPLRAGCGSRPEHWRAAIPPHLKAEASLQLICERLSSRGVGDDFASVFPSRDSIVITVSTPVSKLPRHQITSAVALLISSVKG